MRALAVVRHLCVGQAQPAEAYEEFRVFGDNGPRRLCPLYAVKTPAKNVWHDGFGTRRRISTPDIRTAAELANESEQLRAWHVKTTRRTPAV